MGREQARARERENRQAAGARRKQVGPSSSSRQWRCEREEEAPAKERLLGIQPKRLMTIIEEEVMMMMMMMMMHLLLSSRQSVNIEIKVSDALHEAEGLFRATPGWTS